VPVVRADRSIYLAGIAEMNGIDLADQIERKMAINERRTYHRDAHGVSIRT
jgi:NTP pyrophosphatase (non-canonical NTP hydrolase)